MIVHYPKTEEGKHDLAKRVAAIHADLVSREIQKLGCPSEQQVKLLDSIIKTAAGL